MRKILEAAGILTLAILIWITWSAVHGPNSLPDRIPTHFDAAGNPNGWGSPSGMFFMPVVACGLYLLMSVVALFPSSFNYPVRVTPLNLARLQAITLRMVSWIKVEMAVLFTVLQWAFIQAARTGQGSLFPRILPISIVVIFGTIGVHIVALFRAASRNAS